MQAEDEQKDQLPEGSVRPFKVVLGGPARVPDPEVTDRTASRKFTAADKARIFAEADRYRHGEFAFVGGGSRRVDRQRW